VGETLIFCEKRGHLRSDKGEDRRGKKMTFVELKKMEESSPQGKKKCISLEGKGVKGGRSLMTKARGAKRIEGDSKHEKQEDARSRGS